MLCVLTGTFDIVLCVDVNETTTGQAKSRKDALIPELKNNGAGLITIIYCQMLTLNCRFNQNCNKIDWLSTARF